MHQLPIHSVTRIICIVSVCTSIVSACGGHQAGGNVSDAASSAGAAPVALKAEGANPSSPAATAPEPSTTMSTPTAHAARRLHLASLLLAGSYTSPAAMVETPKLCTTGSEIYPKQWTWGSAFGNQARAATPADNLTPKIEQVRNGKVIATYTSFASNPATCSEQIYNGGSQIPTASSVNNPSSANPAPYAAQGCGPFGNVSHVDLFRLWQAGDTFLVYPAVYTGSINNIFIGPEPDYYLDPVTHIPANITIQGLTQNGIRPVQLDVPSAGDWASAQAPVYIWNGGIAGQSAANITFTNIDIALDTNFGYAPKAGIYSNGSSNLTLDQMRIHGFELNGAPYGANGIFATGNDTGIFTLKQIELFDNGGAEGPAHNIYVNTSLTDPNYTVHMVNSWSHDAYYGHTFKSRAQINILEGNYFQGGVPQGGTFSQAENYLVDISNGGVLQMRSNILIKNASGPNSNGASVTYDPEGLATDESPVPRTYSVDIENNTFVAFSSTYDGTNPLWPFFFWNEVAPGTPGFQVPVLPTSNAPSAYVVPTVVVAKNAFVGYCPQTYPSYTFMNYRGDVALTEAFGELNLDFSFSNPWYSTYRVLGGTPAYAHAAQNGLTRKNSTFVDRRSIVVTNMIGAEDN